LEKARKVRDYLIGYFGGELEMVDDGEKKGLSRNQTNNTHKSKAN
jgi:hypothetical protein